MDLGALGQIAKVALYVAMGIHLTRMVINGNEWRDFYSHLSLQLLLIGTATLAAVAGVWFLLDAYLPGMRLSWLNLFGSEGGNLIVMSGEAKFFGIIFLIILLLALPKLAIIEEAQFRQGTESWPDGVVRSLLFGLIHCIVGVPLGAGIALSVSGLVYTYQYFKGGVRLSALTHFHYNLVAVGILMAVMILLTFG